MASFSAELRVGGNRYPITNCTFGTQQATDPRGRASAKVRHGPVRLTLDVPDDNFLLAWAADPHKRLPADVVFRDAATGSALETLGLAAAYCVGYEELFVQGDARGGAYQAVVTLADPAGFTLRPGGPTAAVGPQQGFVNPVVVPLLTPAPVVAPLAEAVAEATAAAVLAPVALILALILGSTTPAHAPGLPAPPLRPVSRDELRLRELVARHAAGTLISSEETELIALLAKVRGVHIQSLEDLNVSGPLRGSQQSLPGFHKIDLRYTKRSNADLAKLRGQFAPIRAKFVKDLASDPVKYARLKQAGLTDEQLKLMAGGNVPKGWRVHHKLPLDDTGDNRVDNLMLIEDDPWHLAITNYQNVNTIGLGPGQTVVLKWPMYDGYVYP